MTRDPSRRGIRPLATAAALVTTTLVATAVRGPDGLRPVPLTAAAVVIGVAAGLRLRRQRTSPLGATGLVVAAALGGLATRQFLLPTGQALDTLLTALGAVFVTLGMLRNDRRLSLLGVGQWTLAVVRPLPGGPTWRHCLLATDVTVPLPRTDPALLLGTAVLILGLGLRRQGMRRDGARGLELGGLALVLVALAIKAAELPGLEALCGTGDAVDGGWAAIALLAGLAAAGFGLATQDAAWAASGLAAVVAVGVGGSLLERSPVWAAVAAVPVVGALAVLERRGVGWPHHLGYVRPWPGSEALPFDDPAEPPGPDAPPVGTPEQPPQAVVPTGAGPEATPRATPDEDAP